MPAAGISGGFIPQHQHTHHVDNTAQAGEVNHDMVTVMQSDYKLVLHSVCVCVFTSVCSRIELLHKILSGYTLKMVNWSRYIFAIFVSILVGL